MQDQVKRQFYSEGEIPAQANNPEGLGSFDSQNINSGKWTEEENLKYVIFLDYHKGNLASKQKRRSYGVFVQMAKFIGTRSPVQCRSHHQKLQEKFINYRKIISCFKNQMGKGNYKQKYQELISKNSSLLDDMSSCSKSEEEVNGVQIGIQTDMSCFHPQTWDKPSMNENIQMGLMYYPFIWPGNNFN